jgi:hypothetical protein
MYRSSVVLLCATSLLLPACASTPQTPNKYGHNFNYEYQTPPQVSEADADECGKRANDAAFKSISGMSDRTAILFGPIGAAVQIARARSKMNSTYEEVMKDCLREKGYVLEDAE